MACRAAVRRWGDHFIEALKIALRYSRFDRKECLRVDLLIRPQKRRLRRRRRLLLLDFPPEIHRYLQLHDKQWRPISAAFVWACQYPLLLVIKYELEKGAKAARLALSATLLIHRRERTENILSFFSSSSSVPLLLRKPGERDDMSWCILSSNCCNKRLSLIGLFQSPSCYPFVSVGRHETDCKSSYTRFKPRSLVSSLSPALSFLLQRPNIENTSHHL